MSNQDFTVNAASRSEEGKGASRRLRRQNLVPAVIYGGNKAAESIQLKLNEIVKHLEHEAFYSHILTIDVNGTKQEAILRDIQRHPYKQTPIHLDFMRVVAGKAITKRVPIHFLNEKESKGVKGQGGICNTILSDITVSCIPSKLPEYIEVDVINLGTGESLHLSDIILPEGVSIPELAQGHDHDLVVVTMEKKKAATEDDNSDEAETSSDNDGDNEE